MAAAGRLTPGEPQRGAELRSQRGARGSPSSGAQPHPGRAPGPRASPGASPPPSSHLLRPRASFPPRPPSLLARTPAVREGGGRPRAPGLQRPPWGPGRHWKLSPLRTWPSLRWSPRLRAETSSGVSRHFLLPRCILGAA